MAQLLDLAQSAALSVTEEPHFSHVLVGFRVAISVFTPSTEIIRSYEFAMELRQEYAQCITHSWPPRYFLLFGQDGQMKHR